MVFYGEVMGKRQLRCHESTLLFSKQLRKFVVEYSSQWYTPDGCVVIIDQSEQISYIIVISHDWHPGSYIPLVAPPAR